MYLKYYILTTTGCQRVNHTFHLKHLPYPNIHFGNNFVYHVKNITTFHETLFLCVILIVYQLQKKVKQIKSPSHTPYHFSCQTSPISHIHSCTPLHHVVPLHTIFHFNYSCSAPTHYISNYLYHITTKTSNCTLHHVVPLHTTRPCLAGKKIC